MDRESSSSRDSSSDGSDDKDRPRRTDSNPSQGSREPGRVSPYNSRERRDNRSPGLGQRDEGRSAQRSPRGANDRFNRDDRPSRPGFSRDDRPSRPGFSRDDRPSRPGFNRDDRPSRPGYNRDDRPSRPGYNRDDRPSRPGYNRDDRPSRPGYNRDDRSRSESRPGPRGGRDGNRDFRPREPGASRQYGALVRNSLENAEIADPIEAAIPRDVDSSAKSTQNDRLEREVWVREDDRPTRMSNSRYVAPPRRSSKKLDAMAKAVDSELAQAGVKRLRAVATRNMVDAMDAYEHDRYQEARGKLEAVLEIAPEFAPALELAGLTNYRLDRWEDALKFLNKNFELHGDHAQDPVVADCLRALGRYEELEEVWKRLKDASPGADIMAEGRIVYASSLSERGEVAKAINILEAALANDRRPRLHDFRQIYVLADMYENAGNVQQARATFKLLMDVDPGLYDVAERLADLS